MKEKAYLRNMNTLVLIEKLLGLKSVNSVRNLLLGDQGATGLLGDQGATNCWSHCRSQLLCPYLSWS